MPTSTSAPTMSRTWWYKKPGLATVTTMKREPGTPEQGSPCDSDPVAERGIFAARSSGASPFAVEASARSSAAASSSAVLRGSRYGCAENGPPAPSAPKVSTVHRVIVRTGDFAWQPSARKLVKSCSPMKFDAAARIAATSSGAVIVLEPSDQHVPRWNTLVPPAAPSQTMYRYTRPVAEKRGCQSECAATHAVTRRSSSPLRRRKWFTASRTFTPAYGGCAGVGGACCESAAPAAAVSGSAFGAPLRLLRGRPCSPSSTTRRSPR